MWRRREEGNRGELIQWDLHHQGRVMGDLDTDTVRGACSVYGGD